MTEQITIQSPKGTKVVINKSPVVTPRDWYAGFENGEVKFYDHDSNNIQQVIKKVKKEIKELEKDN